MLEKSDGDSLDPLEYRTAVGETSKTCGIVFHEMDIEFIDKFIIVHIIREDPPDDAVHQRTALHEEKLPGDIFIAGDQALDDFLVCHLQYSRLESCLKSGSHLLITRLTEKSEHVLLVSLHARLIERIHAENVSADAACLLEEIEESTEVVLVHTLD